MPKRRQPMSLENIALQNLTSWICLIGQNIMPKITYMSKAEPGNASDILLSVIKYLSDIIQYNMPYNLYDRLSQEMFKAIPDLIERTKRAMDLRTSMATFLNQINVAVTLSEVLLSPCLTNLNFDDVPKVMRHVFYKKLPKLTGLLSLNLGSMSGGWKTFDMEPTVVKGISNMKNLSFLSINYDCTDNILLCLCEHCPNLKSIDLSSSKLINDDSINILINLKKLRYVQLYRTSVTLEGYVNVLLNLEHIEDLGRCDELGRVLEYIKFNHKFQTFGLKKFVSRYAPTNHLQLLADMCPLISSVSIFHNTLLSDLMVLISFERLNDLKLLSCDFFADQVKHLLQVKGCNLTSLHLEHVDEIDLNALMYISQFCPDLKTLTFYNCEMIQSTSLYTNKRLDIPPFMNLERLTCIAECLPQHLDFLLSNCFKVKYIHFGTSIPTSDELIEKVLSKNPMIYLEELRVLHSDRLTIASAYKLVEICPNLSILTELESWRVSQVELDCFKRFIKENNLFLDITPFRRIEL